MTGRCRWQEEGEEEEEEEDGETDVVWLTDTSAEAMAKRAEEQLSGATAKLVMTNEDVAAAAAEAKKAAKKAAKVI